MRLLELKEDGSLRLGDYPHEDVPPYAILSHTWGPDDQEISFQDVQHHAGHHKDGYQKVTFCCQQAALDGLKHFWIDTCCIDKSNSQELQEAINSMFRWYRDANHCYVFLTDVHKSSSGNDDDRLSQGQWETEFRSSRWLTRGWTLQELIAPRSVKFFSAEGKALGNKSTLEALLHECTGVPIDALRGRPPADFSINERLSWLGKRKTKRPEDLAYCMFGIFDVHMPLIYSEGQEKAFLRLRREIEPTRRVEPFSTVPFLPDADFVERPDVTAWLDTTLAQPGSRAALIGLGGIGKSQVAIEYAHRTQQQSPSTRLQLPQRHDPKVDVLQLVYDWLFNAENGQWLMILDNADDVGVFFPRRRAGTIMSKQRPLGSLLPQSTNGRILITSRSGEAAQRMTGSKWKTFPMQVMDESQATQLLQKKLQDEYEEKAAALLSSALEYIPLAITQAAAYIVRRSPRVSCSSYLEQFRKSEKKKESLLNRDQADLRRDGTAANSVVVTWQITFEQIQKERRSAADLLSLMSLFHPQEIPEWVLRSYYQRRCRIGKHYDGGKENDEGGEDDDDDDDDDEDDDDDDDDDEDDDGLDDDLETLRDYSLVAVTVQQDIYEMHTLVQFCARAWLSSVGDMARWKQIFLHIMSENYPPGSYENWSKCQQLEPHIAQLLETQPADAKGATEWARLLTNAGWYGWQVGGYERAEVLLWKAVEVREAVLGAGNSDTFTSVSILALVLRYQGKYEEAEAMNRRVLDGSEKALGKDYPSTLTSVSNLAAVLQHQGKYEEAEAMNRRVLNSRENALGKDHPDTLTSIDNLAGVLQGQGKYKEAEAMNRRALDGREKALGKHHPYTLTSVSNLAAVLQHQGKYDEAEAMNRRVLNSRENALGKDHPDTLTSFSNLAFMLQYQGKYEEAEAMNRRALDGREKALGKDHPDTLTSFSNLAFMLQYQGKYEEAEAMNRRVLDGSEKALGKDHPYTLTSVNNLALVLRGQGKYEEAEAMNRQALDGREKALGKDHPDTLTSVDNLAGVLQGQGKYKEAEAMNRRALDGWEKTLGKDHPSTLTSVGNLAYLCHEQNRLDEAGELYLASVIMHR
ncbi:uncharacterized protein B0I36DRAFT_388201 [Microdochium trichocladiopsis]|uniref:Heterokaryon incompatibility domain-containing protein n=1 Tax=Microdochium trichocladiopsis TaxID=1682393 RepID=A0A9P8XX19_9PEZI|nr:uncharacterized protein B0I36DRAFT_388201 [Microdochium trichocladiopsis]KAH7021517.1 hypothetical protein B0I36DRAFT_388201 [Microdochium trichocladiopsis]